MEKNKTKLLFDKAISLENRIRYIDKTTEAFCAQFISPFIEKTPISYEIKEDCTKKIEHFYRNAQINRDKITPHV
jgi:hypothetical protein